MPNFVIGLHRLMFVEAEASNVESAIEAVNYIDIKDESTDEERAGLGFRIREIKILEHDAFDVTDK